MASNPMQKKSRNAFLTGMLLMLIIAAIAMVIMFLLLKSDNKKQEEQQATQTYVYRLNTSVESGEEITEENMELVLANLDTVPGDAFGENDLYGSLYKEIKNDQNEYEYVPRYRAKINMKAGTILSESMLYEGEMLKASARIQEYNMLQLPVQLDIGEYVDIRLLMSNGQDYIVVSHKEVIDVTDTTIWLQLEEDEILLMSNAIVESYISPASTLYVTKYVEPGNQQAATTTYIPSEAVMILIQKDPNVITAANSALTDRYLNGGVIRSQIQAELDKHADQAIENITAQMLEAREKAKEEREEFLYGVE